MTIAAAEAAPGAVAEAETAVSARGTSARRVRRPPAPRAAARPPASPRTASQPAAAHRGEARGFAEGYAADSARKVRNHGKKSLTFTAKKGDYHKVVAAEFVFAVAVVTVAPLVTPGSGSASTGPSPYGRADIQRLAGVFTLFFILALVSHGRPGKFAVTFGLLVDLGILFRASQRGVLKGVASAFGKSGSAGTSASGGGGNVNTGGPSVA